MSLGRIAFRLGCIEVMLFAIVAFWLSPSQAQESREFRIGFFQGREVRYEVLDGMAVAEGDIILGTVAELEAETIAPTAVPGFRRLSSFNSTPTRFWPNGVVPYTVNADVPDQQRITDAVAYFAESTPVRFVPRTTETNYVNFVRGTRGDGVCSSSVGMVGSRQTINTEDACGVSVLVHEMGHAIGFYHEQERRDRNAYVTVRYENIDKTLLNQYTQGGSDHQDVGFYDFASEMQFFANQFSRTGDLTIETVPAGIPLPGIPGHERIPGHGPQYFSAGDLETLRRFYGVAPSVVTITTNPEGLQVRVDGVTITTPASFDWVPLATHTLEAPDPQTLPDSANVRYRFGIWSDGGAQAHTITSSTSTSVYSASFVRQVRVFATVSPAGSGTVNIEPPSSDGFYTAFTAIRFQVVPSAGFSFQRWFNSAADQQCPIQTGTQGLSDTSVVARPTVDSIGCNATFTRSVLTTISSDPPGRRITVDGASYSGPISFAWTDGSTHTISASSPVVASTATVRYIFKGWSDGGADSHTITAAPGSTITARFTTQYLFTVFTPPVAQGVITLNPPTKDGYYDSGTQVRVTATPSPGFVLSNWAADLGGTQNPQTLVVDEQKAVGAFFNRTAPTLTVVNAATFKSGPVSPGEIVTVFGTGIGPPTLAGTVLDATGRLATTLAETQVLFDGVAAPIVYASAGQTSAIVPYAVADRATTSLQVSYQNRRSPSESLTVAKAQPGFFTRGSSGVGIAAAINQDGTANSASNPVARGSVISFYVTGEGQTDPPGVHGLLAGAPIPKPLGAVSVRIGGKPAPVQYAGGAPGLVAGVMQVNAQVPADLLPGIHTLYVVDDDAISPSGVTVAVK